jgi:hypothetical protein
MREYDLIITKYDGTADVVCTDAEYLILILEAIRKHPDEVETIEVYPATYVRALW